VVKRVSYGDTRCAYFWFSYYFCVKYLPTFSYFKNGFVNLDNILIIDLSKAFKGISYSVRLKTTA